jgi:hypothetical protein
MMWSGLEALGVTNFAFDMSLRKSSFDSRLSPWVTLRDH